MLRIHNAKMKGIQTKYFLLFATLLKNLNLQFFEYFFGSLYCAYLKRSTCHVFNIGGETHIGHLSYGSKEIWSSPTYSMAKTYLVCELYLYKGFQRITMSALVLMEVVNVLYVKIFSYAL
jgi:hypothetical protein